MIKKENNFAYIAGANLHKAVQELGWNLDYYRFRIWLSEKYGVTKAYIFIGLISKYKDIYSKKCSYLLRRIQVPMVYLNGLQVKLALKRKSPQ